MICWCDKICVSNRALVGCVVVYQVRFITTKNGRTDYALAGESIELSCHYIMKDEAEDVKQLVWSKDGKNVSSPDMRWFPLILIYLVIFGCGNICSSVFHS